MKKILTITLFSLMLVRGFSQEYPKFSTDSSGNKLVVMTLEQAQALDNKTDLLPLYEKMSTQVGQVDSSCVITIREKDEAIKSQDKVINSQKEVISGKDKELKNLRLIIENYKSTEETYKKEIDNKNKEIDLHLDKISKMRGRILIGSGIGVVVGFVAAIIIPH